MPRSPHHSDNAAEASVPAHRPKPPGQLYLVATPIGNLGDMVPRAIEILHQVDLIAAEDTRHSGRLLQHFGIRTPVTAYHDFSQDSRRQALIARLLAGEHIALISDAGTPLISDPGYALVRDARQLGLTVTPIPGACALIAALSASGLPSDRFCFEGFLPAKASSRLAALEPLAEEPRTLIFYESPHRIEESLASLEAVFGAEREIVLAREITKTFETFLSGTLASVRARVQADPDQRRGEFVVLVRGYTAPTCEALSSEALKLLRLLIAELPLKKAAAITAQFTGAKKNLLYSQGLAWQQDQTDDQRTD